MKIKDRPSVIAHLSNLQGIITRMSTNSSNVKALTTVIYTITTTVLVSLGKPDYICLIGILCSIFGWLFDSYYLGIEKVFRSQYTEFNKKLNKGELIEEELFEIPSRNVDFESEKFYKTLEALFSKSTILFYGVLILISLIIYSV